MRRLQWLNSPQHKTITKEEAAELIEGGLVFRCKICDGIYGEAKIYHPRLANISTWDDKHLPFTKADIIKFLMGVPVKVESNFTIKEERDTARTKGVKARKQARRGK